MTPKIKLIISIAVIIFLASFVYFLIKKPQIIKEPASSGEKSFEDVLKSLTAPAGNAVDVPADVLKSLTAPAGKPRAVPRNVLDSLTAPSTSK